MAHPWQLGSWAQAWTAAIHPELNPWHHILAALSASQTDKAKAKQLKQQGFQPVEVPKTPYRPKVKSTYIKPEFLPDDDDPTEVLYKQYGNVMHKDKQDIGPRMDTIYWDDTLHQPQFDQDIQWRDTPPEFIPILTRIIKRYWDVFDDNGVSRPIRGFTFHIDTGPVQPFSCTPPRYGPHETRVINELVQVLQDNGWIEDDEGPWGSIVVLAAKPSQEHKPWWEFIFRLCVSYRKLNSVTRPFRFPAN